MTDDYSRIKHNTERILYYLAISGGLIALSIIAPKLPYEILKAYLKNKEDKETFKRYRFNRDLKRLCDRGDIKIKKGIVKITKQGRERILIYKLNEMKIIKPKKWDKKWRLVVFDIPNLRRKTSNFLRKKLLDLGFLQYQKSIFIYPHPCRDEIDYIREICEIGNNVKMIIASEIDDADYFLERFTLKLK